MNLSKPITDKEMARRIAQEIYFIKTNFYCDECDKWFPKEDFLDRPYCPFCGSDMSF